jgi:hypothetical protein
MIIDAHGLEIIMLLSGGGADTVCQPLPSPFLARE